MTRRIIAGAIVAAVGAILVGLLEIRRIGVHDGAVFDFNNVVTGIGEPGVPLLQLLGLAACGALLLLFISWDIRGSIKEGACVGTLALLLTLVAVFVYVGVTTDYVALRTQPPLPGLEGWLFKAAYHPVIHTVFLFGILAPLTVRQLGRGEDDRRATASPSRQP